MWQGKSRIHGLFNVTSHAGPTALSPVLSKRRSTPCRRWQLAFPQRMIGDVDGSCMTPAQAARFTHCSLCRPYKTPQISMLKHFAEHVSCMLHSSTLRRHHPYQPRVCFAERYSDHLTLDYIQARQQRSSGPARSFCPRP